MADQSDRPQESPEPENWRSRLWKITDHGSVGQVVGGLILAALLGLLGLCSAEMASPGGNSNDSKTARTPSSPRTQEPSTVSPDPTTSSITTLRPASKPVFTGRLVVGGEKEIDTVPPKSLDYYEIGDLYFNSAGDYLKAKDGASLGTFTGAGAPTLNECDETAQAAGATNTSFQPKRGDWLCVRTASASVMAWKITKVADSYLEGDATIWHLDE